LISIEQLPTINASLNTLATVLLTAGFIAIKRKHVPIHRACMVAAFLTSALFLICYVIYHVGIEGSKPFVGPGWVKPFYYTMLITHIILAAALLPLVLITMHRAVRGRFDQHRRIARVTWPIWMYVSVTGVLIYLALYVFFPDGK
jgi:uncharacterized membrane protein YozB (DUF420 family)